MADDRTIRRLGTHDVELGITDALQKHATRFVVPPKPVSQRKLDFEHKRPRLLRECIAEAAGVFFYVLPGIGAIASFTLHTVDAALPVPFYGNILQVGFAFALGIAFAIISFAHVSGGHFNPAITIAFAVWQGFPWRKVPFYIASQIFGSFLAGMVLMGCYWPEIRAFKEGNEALLGTAVFNGGAASILCSFPNPNQTNQGYLFFQEFMVCSFLAIVIWTCLDPANPFVSPSSVPFTIGLAYAAMIWAFAVNTISTNTARDLGTRIVAAIFFGGEAFTYDSSYAWIAILVNIPATLFATGFYELVVRDSLTTIAGGHAAHAEGESGLVRHLTKTGKYEGNPAMEDGVSRQIEQGYTSVLRKERNGV